MYHLYWTDPICGGPMGSYKDTLGQYITDTHTNELHCTYAHVMTSSLWESWRESQVSVWASLCAPRGSAPGSWPPSAVGPPAADKMTQSPHSPWGGGGGGPNLVHRLTRRSKPEIHCLYSGVFSGFFFSYFCCLLFFFFYFSFFSCFFRLFVFSFFFLFFFVCFFVLFVLFRFLCA